MATLFAQLILNGVGMGLIYVILAGGLVLIMSVDRVFFIAYGQLYTIGAYLVWASMTFLHFPYPVSLLISVLATAVIGLLSYQLIFRHIQFVKQQFLAVIVAATGLMNILSQGTLLVFGTSSQAIPPVFNGKTSFAGISITNDKLVFIILGVLVVLLMYLVYEKTGFGRVMRAVSFSPEAAALQGVRTNKIFLLVMAIGCALAGFTGGIMAPSYSISPTMGSEIILSVLLIMMLGGMGSMLGAIPAGLIVGMVMSFGIYYVGNKIQIILYILIGIIIFIRPSGLAGGSQIDI